MDRRNFLKSSLAGTALLLGPRSGWSRETSTRVEILLDEPIGRIAPEIYGHFAEHLGGVIYDGIWVGEGSKIANVGGIRKALIERLRQIKAPVIRWPGGCFADSYDWHDGVGPRHNRPTRTNFWADGDDARAIGDKALQLYDDNAFGTDEFLRFCRLSGAQPYLAANLRSLPAQDFVRWLEYCNSPAGSTSGAHARAANGSTAPYDVRYWGIGNESWGCGGNFSPEEYASEYMRFTSFAPSYGKPLSLIGAGPGGNDLDWTRRFFEAMRRKTSYSPPMTGWSLHHYVDDLSRGRPDLPTKGDALTFDDADWFETLAQGLLTEDIVTSQWALIGDFDKKRAIKLVVDEYGAWYRAGSQLDRTHLLGQQSTLRDALLTAMTLDIFNRHADKVGMANCAQMINCLNALFFCHEDKFIVTPVFHVFDLYQAHSGGNALRMVVQGDDIDYDRDGKAVRLPRIHGSASRRDKTVTLSLTNASPSEVRLVEIALNGTGSHDIISAEGRVLANVDNHAHNSFEHPDAVRPTDLPVTQHGGLLMATLPPASVARIISVMR